MDNANAPHNNIDRLEPENKKSQGDKSIARPRRPNKIEQSPMVVAIGFLPPSEANPPKRRPRKEMHVIAMRKIIRATASENSSMTFPPMVANAGVKPPCEARSA